MTHASPHETPSGPDWQRTHTELSRLAKSRALLDAEELRWLLHASTINVHRELGFASFAEYIERLFGYTPRTVEDKLRVAAALDQLPQIEAALADGIINASKARELTRVAKPETEAEWLDWARHKTARQVEAMVSGRTKGDRPGDPARAEARRHVLSFEVGPETLALFREAMAKLRRDSGEPLSEEAALLLMARQVLGGPIDDGRSSYQIAIDVCEACGRAAQVGKGKAVPVDSAVAEMAACDAQHIGRLDASQTHVGDSTGTRASQSIPPAIRRQVLRRDRHCCVVPGCRHATFVDVHHLTLRSEGGVHDPDELVTLCGAHHMALHKGRLCVEGTVTTGLRFRHADGSPYGHVESPLVAERQAKAFAALRHMGFREGEVKRALGELRQRDDLNDLESVIRAALLRLVPAQAPRHAP